MSKLGNLVDSYVKGKVPKNLVPEEIEGSFPYITPDFLRNKGEVDFYAVPDNNSVVVDDNDVIVLWDGSNAGEIFTARKGILSSTMVKLEVVQDKIDKDYFCYGCKNIEYILKAKTAGSGIPHADKGVVKGMEIYIPDAPSEQKAIAGILSKVDEAIEAVETSIKAVERLKKSLMQNLLTGKLKPGGTWRSEDEFQMTKIGFIPKDWSIKTVKELSTQVTDGEHTTPKRSDTGFYLLSARNIKNSYLDLSNVDYVPEDELRKIQRRCNPQAGDILISCSGTIGNVCIVPDGLDAGMVRSAALVKLKKDMIEAKFAELVFQSHSLQIQMKVSVASSVQGNIFQGAIKKLRLPYPSSKSERDEISNRIKGVSDFCIEKQSKIQILKKLKKSLMQNLLTGKVRVDVEKINKLLEEV